MNVHYIVVQETYMDEAYPRTAYGIAAVEAYEGCLAVMQAFPDISPDLVPVQRLVESCNVLQLELIHLQDVVEDFFTEIV